MPAPISYLVASNAAAAFTDGTQQQPLVDRYGNARVVEFRGKYGEANSRGQVFHFCTPVAGVTLPIFSNTAQTYALMNPAGSGVLLELIRLDIGYLSAAQAPGNVVLATNSAGGANIATGSGGVTVATATKGQSGQYGATAPAPVSKCSVLSTITTAAPVLLRTVGFSMETAVAAGTNNNVLQSIPFDGTDLIYPNTIVFIACTVAAGVGVDVINMTAMEVPWVSG